MCIYAHAMRARKNNARKKNNRKKPTAYNHA